MRERELEGTVHQRKPAPCAWCLHQPAQSLGRGREIGVFQSAISGTNKGSGNGETDGIAGGTTHTHTPRYGLCARPDRPTDRIRDVTEKESKPRLWDDRRSKLDEGGFEGKVFT